MGYLNLESLDLFLLLSNVCLLLLVLYLIDIVLLFEFFNFMRQRLPFGLILLHFAAFRALSSLHRFRCLSNLKLLLIFLSYCLATLIFASATFARQLKCLLLLDVEFLFKLDDAFGHALHLYLVDIQNFLESSLDADYLANLHIEVLPPSGYLRLFILALAIGLLLLNDLHTLLMLVIEHFLNRSQLLLKEGNDCSSRSLQCVKVVLEKCLFLLSFHND